MRLLLLLLALLAVCPGARAQLVPAATPTGLQPAAAPAPAPTVPDTAAALHRLFAQRRQRGRTTLKVGGTLLVGGGLFAAIAPSFKGWESIGVLASGVLLAASSVPVLVSGLINNATASKKREQHAQLAWQQHRLPRRLKRALEADSLLAAQAQLAQAVAAALGPVSAAAAPDTAAALHQLFATKRRVLRVAVSLTTVLGAGLVATVVTQPSSPRSPASVLLGTTTLLVAAAELATLRKYSKAHEQQALSALKEHRLPAAQRRELKAEYFRPAKATP